VKIVLIRDRVRICFSTFIVIYNVGQSAESLYIIKSGRVALDVFYEIERNISIPVGPRHWEL